MSKIVHFAAGILGIAGPTTQIPVYIYAELHRIIPPPHIFRVPFTVCSLFWKGFGHQIELINH